MKLLLCLVAAVAVVAGCVGSGPGAETAESGAAEVVAAAGDDDFDWLQTVYQAYLFGGEEGHAAAQAAYRRAVTARTVGAVETWQGGGLTGRVETLMVQDQCLFAKQEVDAVEGEPTWACRNPDGTWIQCGIGPGGSDPGSGPECGDP